MIRWSLLVLLLALAAIFIVATGDKLPSTVASHFGAGGRADGFMSRDGYVAFMAAITVGVPLLIALGGLLARLLPTGLVNLPNKDYWLAPERRDAALATLERWLVAFAGALAFFLCYVHWLVVEANAATPPRLPETPFIAGLAIFIAAALGWSIAFYSRFAAPVKGARAGPPSESRRPAAPRTSGNP